MLKDVVDVAGVRLGPGTLYGCLAKLEEARLIEALAADERRHPYEITDAGRALLLERLSASARVAEIGLSRVAGTMS